MLKSRKIKIIQLAVVAGATAFALAGCHAPDRHRATYYSGTTTTYPGSQDSVGGSVDHSEFQSGSAGAQSEFSAQEQSHAGAEISEQSRHQTASQEGDVVIPLFREEVQVGTRTVDAGTVQLRKTIETETVNEPVQIRRESVSIERRPASGDASQAQPGQSLAQSDQAGQNNIAQPFQEGQIEVRLQREEPVVERRIVPAGEVVVHRSSEVQQTNIQSQVRTEDVAVIGGEDSESVNVSQNLRGSQQSTDAMGGTADVGGQARGGASSGAVGQGSGTITHLSQITSANANAISGQTVRLTSVPVQQSYGNRFIALQPQGGQGSPILVQLSQPQQFRAGEMVTISGTIKRPSELSAQSGMSEQAQQALQGRPIFIEARSVERSNTQ